MSAALHTYPRRPLVDAGVTVDFETISATGVRGLRPSKLLNVYELRPGLFILVYDQAGESARIFAQDGVISASVSTGGVTLPIKAEDLRTILSDLRMAMRKHRKDLPEAVEMVNGLWELVKTPAASTVIDELDEPLELIAVIETPTKIGPYMVNRLTLDGEDLEELAIMHEGRELVITRTTDGYACEWSDDWSEAPNDIAIALLLALPEHTPDDEVAIACEAAAGMIEGAAPEDEDEDDIIAEVLDELAEEQQAAEDEPEQASIIDVPEPKAAPVSRAAIVPMAWLTLDERCQPRTGIDEATVARYVEAIQSGAKLPPIEVVVSIKERPIWVVDGWHRVEAHKRLKRDTIMAIRHKGELRDAIWRALSANATNGLQRTQADLARAIGIALDDPEWAEMSDRALAKHVGCSDKTIARHKRLRQEAAERAQEGQESLPKKSSPPQEVLDSSADIRTTTTAAPERCTQTLDLVETLGAPPQAEAPEVSTIDTPTDEPSSDERYTPRDVIELARVILGGIGLDPASCREAQEAVKAHMFYTAQDDALTKDWGAEGARTVWLNPPYSRALIAPFAKKFLDELDAAAFEEALVLVNASVCATWWQDLARRAQLIAYPPSRLAFRQPGTGEQKGNLYDSSMLWFGPHEEAPQVRLTLMSCDWLVTSGGGL